MSNDIEKYQPHDIDDGAFSDASIPEGEPVKWNDHEG
jgi:hypothetical protein